MAAKEASDWQKRRSTGRRARSWKKRTSGQKQVFGLGGCERKGQQRLDDEIRADHDSEGAKLGSGCTAQSKAQRSRVRLAETERELEDRFDVRQTRRAPRRPRRRASERSAPPSHKPNHHTRRCLSGQRRPKPVPTCYAQPPSPHKPPMPMSTLS
ncbi:uncharacterized protein M437DRAFT_64192 [Aureobasidium melanogenum CBS 110374]|uniref:Uncharacterized protein n=1 Tax=Aureobasidium melanogenum (strain CBS 110374) TaxID=1043003 RepID=A0A074VVQ4_AURM1|nr:uncharacterized protein M437DRAFT_64192 [Aureobasidium melanogenum CBS 110374]KEQ64543.1 hypothetical protein M437DRAFT_64192 [Aureobasidium melanogenum CBS 110374]